MHTFLTFELLGGPLGGLLVKVSLALLRLHCSDHGAGCYAKFSESYYYFILWTIATKLRVHTKGKL